MRGLGVDALVVSLPPNVRYLTGFTGSHGLAFVTADGAWLLTDSRYRTQSAGEVKGFRRIVSTQDLWVTLASRKLTRGCRRVAFESESVTFAHYTTLRGALPRTVLVPCRGLVEEIAVTKDPYELSCIRRAAAITDRVFGELLQVLRPGISELDIAAEITYRHRRHGADSDAFEPIVAGGSRAASPHARASSRRVRSGELLTLDFGCVVDGYCSDLTRTVAFGRIGREQKAIYGTVLTAQREAIDAARAGIAAADLDAVARGRIAADGYGRYFSHSLGHGIGLRIHERPRVSHLSSETLQVGSVITIEPGVYIPDCCGVRIEDDVLLTSSGCAVLTRAPKEFMIL